MQKSHTKQLLLAAMFGPLGVLYTSTAASLLLTLSTLAALYVWPGDTMLIIIVSFTSATFAGCLLAILQNRKSRIRNFTCSEYIGRVSCRVIDSKTFKRDYGKRLSKVRRNRALRKIGMWSVTGLAGSTGALIVFPDLLTVVDQQPRVDDNSVASGTKETPTPESSKRRESWRITADTASEFSALLGADQFQDSSVGLYRPKLMLSCVENRTGMSFVTAEVLGTGSTELTLGFDQAATADVTWHTSADYQSAKASSPINFIRRLNTSESVQIDYLPFAQQSVKSVNFDVSDSAPVVHKVRSLCHW